MGENSSISWTHHTFNPWEGCQRVSPGCQHCYAEARNHRFAGDDTAKVLWGPKAPRRRTSASNWRKPVAWDKAAREAGRRDRVFCASLADVFENRPDLAEWRVWLFDLVRRTPNLDWLLLTKRPQNVRPLLMQLAESMRHSVSRDECDLRDWVWQWMVGNSPPANVWLGTTVEDQQRADERIPVLLETPARVRFLSCEPLLERVDLSRWLEVWGVSDATGKTAPAAIDWLIVGGESGPKARPFFIEWARSLMRQANEAGVAVFVKQLGSNPGEYTDDGMNSEELDLTDRAGGDMAEWPADLRVREFPEVTTSRGTPPQPASRG